MSVLQDLPENVAQLLSVSKILLLQAVDVLDNHLTSDEQLTVNSQYLHGSTIGAYLPGLVSAHPY